MKDKISKILSEALKNIPIFRVARKIFKLKTNRDNMRGKNIKKWNKKKKQINI